MKKVFSIGSPIYILIVILNLGCGESSNGTTKDLSEIQSDPVKVVQAIFDAAKSGDYSLLPKLSKARDHEIEEICTMADQSKEKQEEFKSKFQKGKVVGEAIIKDYENDEAKVLIKFGPEANDDEDIKLIQIDGKWYLSSM